MRKIAHFCRIFRAKLKFLQILQAESVSKKKKKNFGSRGGPSVNEVSFRARPHHIVYSTMGVDT
jgi:hypothetical protein